MKKKKTDLIGKKFGDLTVLEHVGISNTGHTLWKTLCSCGREKIVHRACLTSGSTKACGLCKRSTHPNQLIGQKFGFLEVLDKAPHVQGRTSWWCKCICGNTKAIQGCKLKKGAIISCGCKQTNRLDLTGQKFGRLNVIEFLEADNNTKHYICLCDCGNEVLVRSNNLRRGISKSCGCLKLEMFANFCRSQSGSKHPHWRGGNTLVAEKRHDKEYRAWRQKVMDKWNHCCYICGDINSLEVHHLDAFLTFPDKRTDVENGVCLCETCHGLFHMEYGRGDTIRAQFDEFLLKYKIPPLPINSV